MDDVYFVRENNNKKITVRWNKPKDGLYKRFIYDFSSLLKKYEFAIEEEVTDKAFTVCLSYAKSLDGSKGLCCMEENRPECPWEGDYSKCKGQRTYIPCNAYVKEMYHDSSTGEDIKTIPKCYGTKEIDECDCGGNKLKCSFYKYDEKTGELN